MISARTRIVGIIGWPVAHSLSPLMHNAAFRECSLDYRYVAFPVHPGSVAEAVAGIRALGLAGCNVTIPHKAAVIPFLDELDESAEAAGAVNVIHNLDGRLIGYNTDGEGLLKSLAEDLGYLPATAGGTIMILGAGGAGRGAVAALCRAGAKRIVIINRTRSRAEELAHVMAGRYRGTEILPVGEAEVSPALLQEVTLLLNTTSVGMHDDKPSFPACADLPAGTVVYDMVYAPPVTPLLREAAGIGLRCANGLGMLAGQGECAFRIWTGIMPPAGLMKSVLRTGQNAPDATT